MKPDGVGNGTPLVYSNDSPGLSVGSSPTRHDSLAHLSWRTYQPFGRRLGSRGLLARGAALVMRFGSQEKALTGADHVRDLLE